MKPETIGMSSARLARLDEVMKRRYVDSGYLPGALTYIYRKGHLAHTGMCGRMDIERDKPMREDAIFRIYSMGLVARIGHWRRRVDGIGGWPVPDPGQSPCHSKRTKIAVTTSRSSGTE